MAAGQAPGVFPHEHAPGRARLLEPRRDVQRIADQIGVTLADHYLAGLHADPQCQRLAVLFGEFGRERHEALLQRDPREHRAVRVVLGNLGNAERGHHAVTHELRDRSGVGVDHLLEQRVVAGEHATWLCPRSESGA